MIFNILSATWLMHDSTVEYHRSYQFNREFVRSMINDFSEDHLIDSGIVIDEIASNELLFDRFVEWLQVYKGFASCKPWRIPSNDSNGYQPLLGFGVEISDNDPAFVKWKVSRE